MPLSEWLAFWLYCNDVNSYVLVRSSNLAISYLKLTII